jgi:putative transposase
MKAMEFTESQIVEVLCKARSNSIDDVARNYKITVATICAWRTKFGELGAEDIKRMRHLKKQHAKRQRLVAKVKLRTTLPSDELGTGLAPKRKPWR